jgi:hypothetical protein
MSGALLNAAKKDTKLYVKEGGFQEDILLSTPSGDVTIQTTGLAAKHHINFDTDGTSVNAKNAHICIDEEALQLAAYPVRVDEEINLLNHRVTFKDSSGINKKYIVKENFPDETLGLIVCVLGDFEE